MYFKNLQLGGVVGNVKAQTDFALWTYPYESVFKHMVDDKIFTENSLHVFVPRAARQY